MAEDLTEKDLKGALVQWAAENEVRPVDFAETMGYSDTHAWTLLRGEKHFTTEALGRFVLRYGLKETRKLFDALHRAQKAGVDVHGGLTAGKETDSYVVPTVSRSRPGATAG